MKKLFGLIFVSGILAAGAFAQSPPDEPISAPTVSGSRKVSRPSGRVDTSKPSIQLMFMPTPMFQLAFRPDVMAELKLSADDRKTIGIKMMKVGMPNVQKSGDPEGAMRRWLLNQNQVVVDGLSPEQRTRLTEIYFQFNGYIVLNEYDNAKKLGLSEDQRDQIKRFFAAASKKIKASYMQKEGDSNSMLPTQKSIRNDDPELRKEVNEQIKGILTAAQIEGFDKEKGVEFKFTGGRTAPRG